VLDRAAQALLAKETLDEAEIAELSAGLVRQQPAASYAPAAAR
jgi:hypothetical protein